ADAASASDGGGHHSRGRAVLHGAVRKCLPGADPELRRACAKESAASDHGSGCRGGAADQPGSERFSARTPARGGTGTGSARTLRMKTVLDIALSATILISCGRRN